MNASAQSARSTLTQRRSFMPWGIRTVYRLDLPLSPSAFCALAAALPALLPEEVYSGKPLRDLKGREPASLPDPTQAGDELFFAAGTVYTGTKSERPAAARDLLGEPFQLRALSKFVEFDGPNHIVYSPAVALSDGMPHLMGAEGYLRDIGSLVPLVLEKVRLGLEFFSGSFAGSMFGFSPAVTETVRVELEPGNASVLIDAVQKSAAEPPLARGGYFEKLSDLLRKSCSFNLGDDFRGKRAA
jgi:hypothetical protein